MERQIEAATVIAAPPPVVWEALTNPESMKQWMAVPEMEVEIQTDWAVGGPITIRGFHNARFENTGTVLKFEPERVLSYSHLSSLSQLPDKPENYSTLEFRLAPAAEGTALAVTVRGFPTESIFSHLAFYWRGTLPILKRFVEETSK